MEPFKRLLRKLFFQKMWVTLLSIPVAAVLLIYTFAGGHKEDGPQFRRMSFLRTACHWSVLEWDYWSDTRKKMLS